MKLLTALVNVIKPKPRQVSPDVAWDDIKNRYYKRGNDNPIPFNELKYVIDHFNARFSGLYCETPSEILADEHVAMFPVYVSDAEEVYLLQFERIPVKDEAGRIVGIRLAARHPGN